MIPWNSDDWDVVAEAVRYNITRRERGDTLLPIVYVPLYWRTSPTQPDTAEVRFPESIVARRFKQYVPKS